MLASRFGGTPWAWRDQADEPDWGTCLRLLEEEQQQINETKEDMQ